MMRLLGVLVLLGLATLPIYTQQTAATLVGTVTDSTGAVVSNAVVRVTNLATNVTREAESDQTGSYNIPFLTVGDYSVTATQKGFQTSRVERVTLQVQQTARVDFILKVGEVSETIN